MIKWSLFFCHGMASRLRSLDEGASVAPGGFLWWCWTSNALSTTRQDLVRGTLNIQDVDFGYIITQV